MLFYGIELETTIHYISLVSSLPFYSWLIIRHKFIISLYSYALRIEKTSDSYLYSTKIRSEFVFGNIRIRIRIRFANMETDMGRALSDPHPIRFHQTKLVQFFIG
jgi:hypothetical protein